MSWSGKIIGGVIGGFAGGPIGAAAGAFIGNLFDSEERLPEQKEEEKLSPEQLRVVSIVMLLVKLSCIDNDFSVEERVHLKVFFKETLGLEEDFDDLVKMALEDEEPFEKWAQVFVSTTEEDPSLRITMMHALFELAAADNILHPAEEYFMTTVAGLLGLSDLEYEAIKNEYFLCNDEYYKILGCTPESSNAEVKACYMQKVKEMHPDKLPAGLPAEIIKFAQEKFDEIQTAYNVIRQERNF